MPRPVTFIDITSKYDYLYALAADTQCEDQAVMEELSKVLDQGYESALELARVIKNLEISAKAKAELAKSIAQDAKKKADRAEWLTTKLIAFMENLKIPSINEPDVEVKARTGSGRVEVVNQQLIKDEKYWNYQEPTLNKAALLEDLRAGVVIDGVKLVKETKWSVK